MAKMKALHIFTSFWKRRAIRKALEELREIDETGKFAFVEIKEKNQFIASVYDEGETLQKIMSKIDPKAQMDLK
jgi:hypothetical protein